MIVFGLGFMTVAIALFLYSLLPVIRNTYVDLTQVDPAIAEAGRSVGMSSAQLLPRVQLPPLFPGTSAHKELRPFLGKRSRVRYNGTISIIDAWMPETVSGIGRPEGKRVVFARRESLKQYIRLYPVTAAIIVLQLVMMAVMEWYGSSTDNATLLRFGAMFDLPGLRPEPWRYVASIFLHVGFEHLLFNSFALYVFAAPLERMLGAWRYMLFYTACGVIGNIASAWLHPDYYIGAGASGAIYGVYGAYLFLSVFRKDLIDGEAKKTIRIIVIIGFVYSLVIPNVDIYAHAGGFVGGVAVIWLLTLFVRRRHRAESRDERPESWE